MQRYCLKLNNMIINVRLFFLPLFLEKTFLCVHFSIIPLLARFFKSVKKKIIILACKILSY